MSESNKLYGDEGTSCDDCWHLCCYHCDDDPLDGTIAGCQMKGCKCTKVYAGETSPQANGADV